MSFFGQRTSQHNQVTAFKLNTAEQNVQFVWLSKQPNYEASTTDNREKLFCDEVTNEKHKNIKVSYWYCIILLRLSSRKYSSA